MIGHEEEVPLPKATEHALAEIDRIEFKQMKAVDSDRARAIILQLTRDLQAELIGNAQKRLDDGTPPDLGVATKSERG